MLNSPRRMLFEKMVNEINVDPTLIASTLEYTLNMLKREGKNIEKTSLSVKSVKEIWKNFVDSPMEDKKGAFVTEFLDENDKFVSIPAFAYKRGFVNNLKAKETKIIKYEVPSIKSGDTIKASMYVILAKPSCSDELDLKDKRLTTPILMKQTIYKK